MKPYLVEPALTEAEIAWIDQQIARGRFPSRTAAVMELIRRGLEPERMPASYINDPNHWRRRAAEMRALAADANAEARTAMLRLAADYDRLAARAAQRAVGLLPTRQS